MPRSSEWSLVISPIRATCSTRRIILDMITLIIFVEAYKLRSSSLRSLFHPPATFLPLRSKYSQNPILKHKQSMLFP
jgi:hypothetical protein